MLTKNNSALNDADLNKAIKKISQNVVNSMITDQKLSKLNNLNTKFDALLANKNLLSNLYLDVTKKDLLSNALSNVKELNRFALDDPNKFKFVKTQLNDRLRKLEVNQSVYKPLLPTDNNIKPKSAEQVKREMNHINNVADSAAWVQKNKWMDTRRALGWAAGMNQAELRGLSNKDRFDINWKVVTSAGSKAKKNSLATWKSDFVKLAAEKKQKNIEKYLRSLPKEDLASEDIKELTKELLTPVYNGLNPAGRFQAFLAVKNINYFDNEWDQIKEKTTLNRDIADAIKEIKNEMKYKE
jgi:hypothetical protein